jgi:hypothetical protein
VRTTCGWPIALVGIGVTVGLVAGCTSTSTPRGQHPAASSSAMRTPTAATAVTNSPGGPGESHVGVWARLASRPLHLPRIASGAECPVTRRWTSHRAADLPAGFTPHHMLGIGPAYPGVYTAPSPWFRHTVMQMRRVRHPDVPLPDGWLVNKVLWEMSRHYRTPVLVRGHQVDGPHRMRFYQSLENPPPASQVRLVRNLQGASNFAVPVPGCYAWQLDGKGFSRILIFRVVEASP